MDKNDIAIIESLLLAQQKQITAELSGQYNLIVNDLSHIKEQTTKTNGRVNKLESQMNTVMISEATHGQNCPVLPRLEILEKSEFKKRSIYKFLMYFAGSLGTLIGVVATIMEILKYLQK